MINFRWHRGSLEDSLATSVSFASISSLERYITQQCELMHMKVFDEAGQSTIKYQDYWYYSRCGQDLEAVIVDDKLIGFIF